MRRKILRRFSVDTDDDTTEILIDIRPNLRIMEVFFRRKCNHQTTSNIFGQTDDFIGEARNILFADVSQEQVDEIVARFCLCAQSRASNTASIEAVLRCCISMILSLI